MELLEAVEAISRQQSADIVELALLQTLGENFSDISEALLLLHEDGCWWVTAFWKDGQLHSEAPSALVTEIQLSALAADSLQKNTAKNNDFLCFSLNYASKSPLVLALRCHSLSSTSQHGLTILIKIVENFSQLLLEKNSDRLTGLLNRHQLEDRVMRALANANAPTSRSGERRAVAAHHPNWLAILDIDHFKRINDTLGHLFGDEVLILVSRLMSQSLRRNDQLFRYGGEEFVLLLIDISAEEVEKVLGRFRAILAEKEFPQFGHVTLSIGYTQIARQGSASAVLGEADQALYWAKQNGRNRVEEYRSLLERGLLQSRTNNNVAELF